MSVKNKLVRLQPGQPAVLPYIKGTETPNYYLVLGDGETVIFGFRPLSKPFAAVGDVPQNGEQTRFRVVPKDQGDVERIGRALSILNFESRQHGGESEIHFSTVVSDAASFAKKLETLLSFSGCF